MVRTKVFVGNLSFKTTDKDLAKEFEVAGKVATANIISRGSRSLGYGFVEMESEEEANKSVELLNKKTIDGREINVEVARPREERAPAPAASAEAGSSPAGDATSSPAKRGARRGGNRRPAASGSPASPAVGGDATAATSAAPKKPRAPRTKKPTPGESKTGVEVGTAASGDASGSPATGARRARAPRAPRNDADRTPSKTTLFVANLPFTVDDAQLADLFKGLNIKAAHVVRKPNNNAKSKGFGFVEFNNEEDQLKALEAVNKKVVGERELSVKVALAESVRAADPAAADATTPAATLPATTAPGVAATAESK